MKPTYPERSHRHWILFGCEQNLNITGRLILHISGIPSHLRLQIHENLSRCSFELKQQKQKKKVKTENMCC